MHMSDTVYQVLLGNPLAKNVALWDDALRSCPFFSLVHNATDISGLVSYLAGAGKFVDKTLYPLPDLVLLDLNLSGRGSGSSPVGASMTCAPLIALHDTVLHD